VISCLIDKYRLEVASALFTFSITFPSVFSEDYGSIECFTTSLTYIFIGHRIKVLKPAIKHLVLITLFYLNSSTFVDNIHHL